MNFSIDQSEDKKPWFRDYKYPKGAQSGTGGYWPLLGNYRGEKIFGKFHG